MARHKSAIKRNKQSVATRARNRNNMSQLKTQVKKLRSAIEAGDAENASKLLPGTVAGIDKAAKKGVIHRNAAARKKSRLARAANKKVAAAQ